MKCVQNDKLQTLGLAILVSSNSLAAVLSFGGAYYLVISVCILICVLGRKFSYQSALTAIIILVVYCLISGLVNSGSSSSSSPIEYHYGLFCLSYGLALYTGNIKIDILSFFKCMVTIGLVCAPMLFLKARALAALVFTLESDSGTMMGMTYAIVPSILSAFSLLILKSGIKWKVLSVILIVVLSIILLQIGSRGAFIVFLVFFMLLVGTIIIRKSIYKILFFSMFGLLAAIVVANFDNYLLALDDMLGSRGYSVYAVSKAVNKMGEDSFSNGRIEIWHVAIIGFLENPFGHWVGSFEEQFDLHQHNFVLQMMWEFGLLGLIMAVSIIGKSLIRLFDKRKCREEHFFIITIFCSSIIILMYSGTFWMLPCFWIWLRIIKNKIQFNYV